MKNKARSLASVPLGLGILSGLLLYLAVPPVGLGFLAFFALIPLVHASLKAPSYRFVVLVGFVSGAVFFLPALFWLTSVTWVGWAALGLYCATYFAVFAFFLRAASGHVLAVAGFWVVLEYIRGVIAFTGFPWILLSHTQYGFTAFTQVLDLIGSYGLSGILVIFNILLYRAWQQRHLRSAAVAAGMFVVICLYGLVRIQTLGLEPLLRVAMVQASVPQEMKEVLAGKYDPKGVLERYLNASALIPPEPEIDLIVWPETVVLSPYILNVSPDVLSESNAAPSRFVQDSLSDLAHAHDAFVLVGATSFLPAEHGYVSDPEVAGQIPSGNWRKRYNSAYLLDPTGQYVDRYDKTHLVPFGEYIPLPDLFPFLAKFVPFDASLSPGDRQTIFIVTHGNRQSTFGVLICYEDTNAEMARFLRRNDVDFLVNISNDAWFGLSELDQHFIAARYRAIENRVGVVRSGNNGITGVIDPVGRVGPVLEKNATAAMSDMVATTASRSLYTRVGDWPALLGAILSAIYPLLAQDGWLRRKR